MTHPRLSKSTHIVRMDKRWAGHRQFLFCVDILQGYASRLDRLRMFNRLRNWCVETWGMSSERDIHIMLAEDLSRASLLDNPINKHWSWHANLNTGDLRLYFKSESELNFFTLRWAGDEQL